MIVDDLFEAPQPCPECGGVSFSNLILAEKKDACYYKVKASAKVWPSAYASGRLVQCRKKGADNYGNKNESEDDNFGKPATLMKASPEALKTAQNIVQKQADKNVIGQAKIAGAVPSQGVAEGPNDTIYPNAEVIKSKNGKPVGEIYQDGNSWGAFHYRADRGYDLIDSREDAIEALRDLHQETGRSRPDYTIKGVAEGIEDNYNKNDAGIKAALQTGVKLIPVQSNNDATGKPIYIHDYSGRYTVVVDIGEISVPFYVSTGLGGKAGVAVDKWYPFFGIGPDGWINKGSEATINDFYGSNKLKRVAQVLDNTLGLPSRAKNVSGWPGNRGDGNYFISAVNRGLDPAALSDRSTKLRDNMLSVLRGLGEPNKYVEKAAPVQAARPKAYAFDKNNPEHVAAFDATSKSEREIAMALAKDPKSQGVAEEGERGRGRPTTGEWDPTSGKVGRTEKTAQGIRHIKVDETKPKEKEADYGDDYQAMVARVKKLAGLGPLKTVYDPQKRVYRNVPTAVQPKK